MIRRQKIIAGSGNEDGSRRVTLPKSWCDKNTVKTGDYVLVVDLKDRIVILPDTPQNQQLIQKAEENLMKEIG